MGNKVKVLVVVEKHLCNTIFGSSIYFGFKPMEVRMKVGSTMLAGIPNAPSVYSPDVNPTLAEERRQQVLECMAEAGYIQPGDIE